MALSDQLLRVIEVSGPLDDDEIAQRLKVVRQQVNQTARRLERQGLIRRYVGAAGKIVNELVENSTRRAGAPADSGTEHAPQGQIAREGDSRPDLLLVTCVKTKASAPRAARDLYLSPLFLKQRAYAVELGAPWFILSAEHGLVAPDEWLAPYERYLPETSREYRRAWGEWVVARLELLVGDLRDRVVEVHASSAYVDAIRDLLDGRGARVVEPLHGLTHGRRLAWYGSRVHDVASAAEEGVTDVEDLLVRLRQAGASVSPAELIGTDPSALKVPGLYSWWVDESGAAELSRGLGHSVPAGLVYAGLAGATRWPSGKRSGNTLWSRLTGMHLGRKHEFSTLRRTFGSILAEAYGWGEIDEAALTTWMFAHLRVIPVPYEDADSLGRIEEAVLAALDPPLNLKSVAKSDLRRRLTSLRQEYAQR